MQLMTKAQRDKLLSNGYAAAKAIQDDGNTHDCEPVIKLFAPWSNATWLISELDPEDGDTMFGLCDLGMGEPELGYVSLSELKSIIGRFGLRIERDIHWTADQALTAYAKEARELGRIAA